ncbi:J domain-containing protein [Tumebacillus permanentifrigoris]|uniref:DnaJ-like protein n=1 Tax=Tumebacillus permanentifrigoris TaxID=378543 RepID=A0A316E160_9BACL|nr:J domain-containing protein [Tumebacillus permanentifrigoris]PWK16550.1 DnaJ-like protein [Tumebacillus permanentifrigoris]
MDQKLFASLLRDMEQIDWDTVTDEELDRWHLLLQQWKQQVDFVAAEAAATRAERWWSQIPREEARTIRLLLKGARLTPAILQGVPELYPLLLLIDIQDPQVVQLWAKLSPEARAERIEDLRRALSLTEVRRTTSAREDQSESNLLAYEVLGLTTAATWDQVRKRYRELVAQHHPDRGGDEGLFRAIHKAYKLVEARFL